MRGDGSRLKDFTGEQDGGRISQVHPLRFFSLLQWIDGRPLLDFIEPYRRRIFNQVLYTFDPMGRLINNLALLLRAKKNWKSADLIFAALYWFFARRSVGGSTCLVVATDEGQADYDLDLGKKIIRANPILADAVEVKQKSIEHKDGDGILEIRPGRDYLGQHGGKFDFLGIDELHTQRDWSLLEALQPDPTRESLTWITSYNSIYHRPGVPLFDLIQAGWRAQDPRMYFSYYAADRTTDPDFENASPEDKANPSRDSWSVQNYLEQQQRRLPAHKYRRLHLNLPGLPEGSAFSVEKVMEAVERGVRIRPPVDEVNYSAFVDMSGGSNDDATLAIAHKDAEGRAVLDLLADQGQRPPFDPRKAVERFVGILREYRIASVTGDNYAGQTFAQDFQARGYSYRMSELKKSQLYEALEPKLNAGQVVLLDHPSLESQFLGLVWKGGKIDHASGEHDDFANAAAGAIHKVFTKAVMEHAMPIGVGEGTSYWAGANQSGRLTRSRW